MAAEIEFPLAGCTVGYTFAAGGDYSPGIGAPGVYPKWLRGFITIPSEANKTQSTNDWLIPDNPPYLWSVNFNVPSGQFYENKSIEVWIVMSDGTLAANYDDRVDGVNVGVGGMMGGDPPPGGIVMPIPPQP